MVRPPTASLLLYEDFSRGASSRWRQYLAHRSGLEHTGSSLRFAMHDTTSLCYSDAQLDDYKACPGRPFLWSPPLRLIVCARFSHPSGELVGTAGFGFWNYPFVMTAARLPELPFIMPTLPRVLWFFYASPPSDIRLDLHTPGSGWKAATIDALRPSSLLLAPLAPVLVPLMRSRLLYLRLWSRIQQMLNICEAPIAAAMTDWHIYTIEWQPAGTTFCIDGQPVLEQATAPRGPLCFVVWLDNQYMVVTPWGQLRYGLLEAPGCQWMEIAWLAIERCG